MSRLRGGSFFIRKRFPSPTRPNPTYSMELCNLMCTANQIRPHFHIWAHMSPIGEWILYEGLKREQEKGCQLPLCRIKQSNPAIDVIIQFAYQYHTQTDSLPHGHRLGKHSRP